MSPRREYARQQTQIVVPDDTEAIRLDQFLGAQAELGLSRTKAQRLIEAGEITINGKPTQGKYHVRGGDVVGILLPEPPTTDITPEDIELDIRYEDEYLVVINKPAGIVTHPAAGNYSGTLVNALMHKFQQLPTAHGSDRPGIVHRLDKNTSGLLLVAKQEETLLGLQRAMESREIKRTYLALVCGHMPKEHGTIDLAIGRSLRDRTRMSVSASGRSAVTEYQLQTRFRSYDLLDVHLQTGRTHQIRVHFSHLGHPVFGDPEYGGREKWLRGVFAPERPLARRLLALLPYQALHARRLAFTHPQTGQLIAVESEPPALLRQVLETLHTEGA